MYSEVFYRLPTCGFWVTTSQHWHLLWRCRIVYLVLIVVMAAFTSSPSCGINDEKKRLCIICSLFVPWRRFAFFLILPSSTVLLHLNIGKSQKNKHYWNQPFFLKGTIDPACRPFLDCLCCRPLLHVFGCLTRGDLHLVEEVQINGCCEIFFSLHFWVIWLLR